MSPEQTLAADRKKLRPLKRALTLNKGEMP